MTTSSAPPLSPLIGRDDDLAAVIDQLVSSRLVTLTGPGGSGKTRLAQAVVRASTNVGRTAWFVDCSAVDEAARIVPAIVAAMQLGGSAGDAPLPLIASRVANREALIVLDNLEQIERAGSATVALLEAVPTLVVLATSRRPLAVDGELEFPVGPLGLPEEPTVAGVEASAAGLLFLARTRARVRDYRLDDRSAEHVAALLQRLDGLPLAIELAAARMRTMSALEINRRLDALGPEGVDAGDVDVKRSLRAILEWTAGQLTPDELTVLEAASACAGFDLALLGALASEFDVIPALEALVALGLVQREAVGDASRYRVLATIQERTERTTPDLRRAALRNRHADHFAATAPGWAARSEAGDGGDVVVETDRDADNIRRAFAHLEATSPGRAARMLVELSFFFNARGRWRDGYDAFIRLRAAAVQPEADLVRAALVVADLVWFALPREQVLDLVDWATREAPSLRDQVLLEDALYFRAILAANVEDVATVQAMRAQFDALPAAQDPGAAARRLNFEISAIEAAGDWSSPRLVELLRASIDALGGIDDDRSLWRVVDLAITLFRQGRFEESERMAEVAVTRYLEVGADLYAAWAITWLVQALVERGKTDRARDLVLIAISITRRSASTTTESLVLWGAMPIVLDFGMSLLTARCYGALVVGAQAKTAGLPEIVRRTADAWLARASRGEAPAAIQAAIREGAEADPMRLLETLHGQLGGSRAPGVATASVPALRHGTITPRELEVLALVGAGRSDQDIAAELFISPKTASVHVSNVKSKLGVESRLELALRARDLGLVKPG